MPDARPSDHFDGQHFFNPDPAAAPRGFGQVLRWRMESKRATWPTHVANGTYPPPPGSVAPGQIAVTFINHAPFLLTLPGAVVLTDPIFSERCSPVQWVGPKRVRAPGIALHDLPRPDVVLLSHNHYDHMDLPSLREIARRHAPRFVTTLGNAAALAAIGIKAAELDWWQSIELGGLQVIATPARHFSARTPFDRNRTLWAGFMLRAAGRQLLFAGDSGAGPHWGKIRQRLGAPGVALLPIGAYEPRWFMAPVHMDPAEAVDAHVALGASQSVGMHFGTFQLTDEAIDAPEQALAAALREQSIPDQAFVTHGFGETRVYLSPD